MSRARSPSRRRLLQVLSLAVVAAAAGQLPAASRAPLPTGALELTSLHTGESIVVTPPLDAATERRLQRVLRDHRSGAEHTIDAALLTQLIELAAEAGAEARYEIISAYRSPETNATLRERSTGVSSKSLHMEGRAMDVRLKGVDCLKLAELARAQKRGGVGYYEKSNFVHLDTGRARTWDG